MKKNDDKTNAVRILEQKKIPFKTYTYAATGAVSGIDAAKALGKEPDAVFKTLVTVGKSNKHYVFVVPVSKELDLKKAAASVNEKSIDMVKSKELLGLTGYVHGGCSPIGMKKNFDTVIDVSAQGLPTMTFSGGKIGYQVEMPLNELAKVVSFKLNDIVCLPAD